jgi:hypothetical protein
MANLITTARTLVAGIKYLGTHPCPRCLVEKAKIPDVGTTRDRTARGLHERLDDEVNRADIERVRKWLYNNGTGWGSKYIKHALGRRSSAPTRVSPTSYHFSIIVSQFLMLECIFYTAFVSQFQLLFHVCTRPLTRV